MYSLLLRPWLISACAYFLLVMTAFAQSDLPFTFTPPPSPGTPPAGNQALTPDQFQAMVNANVSNQQKNQKPVAPPPTPTAAPTAPMPSPITVPTPSAPPAKASAPVAALPREAPKAAAPSSAPPPAANATPTNVTPTEPHLKSDTSATTASPQIYTGFGNDNGNSGNATSSPNAGGGWNIKY